MNMSTSRQYLLLGISDGSVIQYKFDYIDVILSKENKYHEEMDPQTLEYLMCEDSIIYVESFDQIINNNVSNKTNKEIMSADSEKSNSSNNESANDQPPQQNENSNETNNSDNGNSNSESNEKNNEDNSEKSNENDNENNTNNNINETTDDTTDNNSDFNAQINRGYYYKANLHDNKNGNITGISLSFDDAYMVSCGSDGAIFVFRNKFEKVLSDEGKNI